MWVLPGTMTLLAGSIPACSAPIAPAHTQREPAAMRKAGGELLILWLMLEEAKPLMSPFVLGPGLGQAHANAVPWGCWGSGGCHPPCCPAVAEPRQAQAALVHQPGGSAPDTAAPVSPLTLPPPLPSLQRSAWCWAA